MCDAPKPNPDPYLVDPKEQFQYAWKHFDFLADQRMRTFNFYAILLAASVGGTLTVFEKMNKPIVIICCGLWHIGIAVCFLILDTRARRMIEIPKNALRWFEERSGWNAPKLVLADDAAMRAQGHRFISYTFAIRSTCLAQILFGLVVAGLAIFLILCHCKKE